MGIIIIFGIGLGIAITLVAISEVKWWGDWVSILGICLIILFGAGFLVTVGLALGSQIPKEKHYQQALYEKQVIEYRLEKQDDNLVGNELLYQDIVNYNNNLRDHKRYSDNFWLNWLYNDKIATIEYIELDGVKNYTD